MAHICRPHGRDGFEIAIICALRVERDAIEALLDEEYETDGFSYGKADGDLNTYTTGRLGNQHVVLVYMPNIGTIGAVAVSTNLQSSFKRIKIGVVVGVCGGVPKTSSGVEIILGDIIISTSVIQIDFGRQYPNKFIRKKEVEDTLGRANPEVRAFAEKISGYLVQRRLKEKISHFSAEVCSKDGFYDSGYPGPASDKLYPAEFHHKHRRQCCHMCDNCTNQGSNICELALRSFCEDLGCDGTLQIERNRIQKAMGIAPNGSQMTCTEIQEAQRPSVHFGRMACSNQVIRSGQYRDQIATEEKVIGFEMESAGTWDYIPTVVIKSVSDYADSHKTKEWQKYAAVTAAACTKALLGEWRRVDESTRSQMNTATTSTQGVNQVNHQAQMQSFYGNVLYGNVHYHSMPKESDVSVQEIIDRGQTAINRLDEEIQRSRQQRESHFLRISDFNLEITKLHAVLWALLGKLFPVASLIVGAFSKYTEVLQAAGQRSNEMIGETEHSLQALIRRQEEVEAERGIVISEVERRVAVELEQDSVGEYCVRGEAIEERNTPSVQTRERGSDSESFICEAESAILYDTDSALGRDNSEATHARIETPLNQNEQVDPQPDQRSVYSSSEAMYDQTAERNGLCNIIGNFQNQNEQLRSRNEKLQSEIEELRSHRGNLNETLQQAMVEIKAKVDALEAEKRWSSETNQKYEEAKESQRNSPFDWCVIL